ncbi:Binding-protein-dependent transport systems inner membrane component [Haloplasma contractile SSD-17B]|uniref:Binding-protein-dependent transport systems inner membrane component n=1 Tax=Haloplasma contractile SSD-17B TaxID=1033810 RepID=U2FFQ5_9MOLU|nr:Binding-protein-dependent transport systems inner membrane component [Haloplasma contractile SSD-17B]
MKELNQNKHKVTNQSKKESINKKKMSYKKQKQVWGWIFVSPWVIGFLVFFLYPLLQSFLFSFYNVKPTKNGLVTTYVGLDKYKEALFVHESFLRTLTESLLEALINLPILLIFSLLIAVLLNTEFKGRTVARALFFIPVIFNSAAITTAMGGGEALREVMETAGIGVLSRAFDLESFLINANINETFVTFIAGTIEKIYVIITFSGVQILIFLAGLQSVPGHLYEAAKIEGATSYEMFWKITLPMVSPLLLTASVFTIVDSFLRSPVTDLMTEAFNLQNYGLNASMSWLYFATNMILLAIVLGIISRGVFYYDE